ncbi:NGG1p interacting factor NIF3 [Porticoccus sp.]
MYKLVFYVPIDHVEAVKAAVFAAGAGQIGNYERCCWQVLGTGQFRPLVGSTPFVGEQDELTRVEEYRVELVCEYGRIAEAVNALLGAHPYEEPAYDVWRLAEIHP